MRIDGQTEMTKLIVVLGNIMKAPKNETLKAEIFILESLNF